MAIDYATALTLREEGRRYQYSERDAMLYAVAIGMGSDRPNEPGSRYVAELPFLYERDLRAVPTFGGLIAWGAGVPVAELGLDSRGVLHGEEEIIFHRPLAPRGAVVARSRIVDIYDRGADRGALVLRETEIRDEADGGLVATLRRTLFARRNGGEGGSTEAPPQPHPLPERAPDRTFSYATAPNQAVLYRLCGDRTALHADPEAARAAGFDTPILHGLCTFGICCRAVLEAYCDMDPAVLASHAGRFSSPVFPGDSIEVRLWRDDKVISFEAAVSERSVTVIKNGRATLR